MKRESKYGTNKTIRFCQKPVASRQQYCATQQLSIHKRQRWKLLGLLKERSTSSDYDNKVVVRRNHNFHQYNGYRSELRAHPPKHVSFPRRPDFVYQPYVHFVEVNSQGFDMFLHHGWTSGHNDRHLAGLLDIDGEDVSVTLIYFLNESKKLYSSDWHQAYRHAFGGSFAGYHSLCWGDYCPFGPNIRGRHESDPRINQVLFILAPNHERKQCNEYACGYRRYWRKSKRPEYKDYRSELKSQRRNKHTLTEQFRTVKNYS